jgi:hypothetical protein
MLRRYFQNSDVHMTRDSYFEMCEMLGQEPIDEEIPVEINDFPEVIQQSFVMYRILQDIWEPMGGSYMGKDFSIVFNLFDLYEIPPEERTLLISFMQSMDVTRANIIANKIKAKTPPTKK